MFETVAIDDLPWWKAGVRVPDIFQRSSDAEFIIDADFAEDRGVELSALEWRECLIPVEAFRLKPTLALHLDAVHGQHNEAAAARLAAIEKWIVDCDGIGHALQQQPLLVTWRDERIHVEDGCHRLACAFFTHGESHVRALCVVMPVRDRNSGASS